MKAIIFIGGAQLEICMNENVSKYCISLILNDMYYN